MGFFVGLGILIVLLITTGRIEKSLKTIEHQNEKKIELLEILNKKNA